LISKILPFCYYFLLLPRQGVTRKSHAWWLSLSMLAELVEAARRGLQQNTRFHSRAKL
jgi:hypothetical protein